MFERYDEAARRSIFFARYEASQNGATAIASLHLLLGLLRESGALFTLSGNAISVDNITEDCRRALPTLGEKTPTSVDMPLTEECKNALADATTKADLEASRQITPKHLALGLITVSKDVAAILGKHGITAKSLGGTQHSAPEKAAAVSSQAAFLEFICQGERIASARINFTSAPPRVGDEVAFTQETSADVYKVLSVRHCFEGPPLNDSSRCWLVKVVIEVERITPAAK